MLICLCLIACESDDTSVLAIDSDVIEHSSEITGIDFINKLSYTTDFNIIEYLYFNNGGGVGVGDIDNDGLEDLFFTSNQGVDKLYKNLGDLKFEDITETASLNLDSTWSTGVAIDDINNDGYKDIYVSKVSRDSFSTTHNLLYINQGDGTFIESAKEYGLDFSGYSTQISFADFDLDGDLDAYLLNHSVHSVDSYGSVEKREKLDPRSGDRLFENQISEGKANFVDITESSGIYSSALGYGLAVITSDINGDGLPDIYVGNDFHENDYLYINQGGNIFKESISSYTAHCSQFTMGLDAADINRDGTLDLFLTDMMPHDPGIYLMSGGNDTEQLKKIKKEFGYLEQYSRNHLFINEQQKKFSEQAYITNTFASDWSWGTLLADFDNNGLTDIFISNGIIKRPNDLDYIQYINTPENRQKDDESADEFNKRLIDQMPTLQLKNILFSQHEEMQFSDIASSKIGEPNFSNGCAYADLDNDGSLEIITNNINKPVSIYKNQTKKNFIGVNLKLQNNTTAKGTRVYIHYNDMIQMREYMTTRGFQSSSSHKLHFGLGDVTQIDSIVAVSASGMARVYNPGINTYHDLTLSKRNENLLTESKLKSSNDHQVRLSTIPILHSENEYDDLDNEPMMHRKYSAEGPAFLVYDFNQDGFKDIYLGGARTIPAQYLEGTAGNGFIKKDIEVFLKDARYEDIDAALIDFNNDGYQDIYVVSGGNDKNQLDESLQDRIYFNDGKGNFLRLPLSLPHMNGSVVAIHDYDNDGYEDMFVGTSNIPGAYGVAPVSFILKNMEGGAVSVVYKDNIGMVSDAQWVDLDRDGKQELIVVGDWMKPMILKSVSDTSFREANELLPNGEVGLYRSVSSADINGDSLPDLLLGNQGYNSAFGTDKLELCLDDFDDNSYIDPIIFQNYFGADIPFANKEQLQKQIPSIKKNFSDYKTFATVDEISKLVSKPKDAIKKNTIVDELGSYFLFSSSDGYHKIEVDRQAQLSPVNKMLWMPEILDGTLIICGNDNSSSHALGNSKANALNIFFGFDSTLNAFTKQANVVLPADAVVKEVQNYDEQSVLVSCHSGSIYLLQF